MNKTFLKIHPGERNRLRNQGGLQHIDQDNLEALGKKKAIIQRGSIEHEQILYESSNRRMKQLMDWLSNSH